jgi:ABC-2 type transport system ATP-binding protein
VQALRKEEGDTHAMSEEHVPVLDVKGLVRRYATLVALGELDLEIEEGEFIALVGPNGAGKSTLLACVAGLLEPSEGEVRVLGYNAGSIPARAATSYLGDEPVLYDDLSLEEHLEYVARLHGLEAWERPAAGLVTRLGLEERVDDLPAHFSKGMRQKTSIALGLLRPFQLLLADEPFDGLDPPSREVLTDLLTESAASGAAVIVSTHRLDIAERASRCIALFDGQVTHDGPADEATMQKLLP